MKKSEKKARSDKINALRKQYEAFLEEDKKRKERNEYILGRLDQIRSCTSIVPHTKPTHINSACQASASIPLPYLERPVFPLYPLKQTGSHPTSPILTNSTKISGETFLLQEIINKYILIPKRDYYNTSIDVNNDWRSKYDILNHLNIEKEESVPTRVEESFLSSDARQNTQTIYKRDLSVLDNEIPVKDSSGLKSGIHFQYDNKETDRTFNVDKNVDINKHNEISFNEKSVNLKYNKDHDVSNKITNQINKDIRLDPGIENLNIASPINIQEDTNILTSNLASKDLETLMHVQPEQKSAEENNVFLEANNYSSMQRTNDLVRAETVVGSDVEECKETDDNEYPIEIVNVSQFTPNDDVELQDGVNVNPVGYNLNGVSASMYNNDPQAMNVSYESNLHFTNTNQLSNEAYLERAEKSIVQPEINNEIDIDQDQNPTEPMVVPNNVDESGIEEFEAEQNEMFYQEQPDAAHKPEDYNSENYQQNEYQYYEGAHEQALPLEINEHEETSERYDQNYRAQYETTYQQQPQNYEQQDYDQQANEQQQQQQYQKNQEGYEEQLGYEHQQVDCDQLQQGYDQLPQEYDKLEQQVYDEEQQQAYDQQSQQAYDQQAQQAYDQQAQQAYDQHAQQAYDQQAQQAYDQQEQQDYEGQQQVYNQQLYDQQQVAYDQQAGYEQQSYDQLQQHYETPQNIEQQLEEEKYVEPEKVEVTVNKDQEEEINPPEQVKEAMHNPIK